MLTLLLLSLSKNLSCFVYSSPQKEDFNDFEIKKVDKGGPLGALRRLVLSFKGIVAGILKPAKDKGGTNVQIESPFLKFLYNGIITHTDSENNPFLDLGFGKHKIHSINLYGDRLTNFKLTIERRGTVVWSYQHEGTPDDYETKIPVPPKIYGDRVTFTLPGSKHLSLTKLQVIFKGGEAAWQVSNK